MGLLDFMNDPQMAGAMGLLASAGPSRMPVSVGQGLAAGYQAQQNAIDALQGREMNQMRMGAMKEQMEAQKARKAQLEAFRSQLPPQYQQLFDVSPESVLKLFEPQKPEHKVVGNNLVKIGPEGVSNVFTAPEKKESIERLMDIAGITDPAERQRIVLQGLNKQVTHPQGTTVTNILPKADSKYAEARLGDQAKYVGELGVQAKSAYNQIGALDRFIANSAKGMAGSAAPILSGVQNFLASFGYDSQSLQSTQQMQQAVGDILGNKMSELGARGLTDKDMQILRESLPRIESDPKARVQIAKIIARSHMRTIDEYENALREEATQYPDLSKRVLVAPWVKDYRKNRDLMGSRFMDEEPAAATGQFKIINKR